MAKLMIVLTAVLLLSTTVFGQTPSKPINFYLKGGVALPQSDFEDGYKMGYQGGAALGLKLTSGLEAVGCVSYNRFSPDVPDEYEIDGGEFTALLYGGEGKLNLGGLFVFAGAGAAKMEMSEITVEGVDGQSIPSQEDTKSYFAFGAGLEFDKLFVEARYVKIQDDIKLSEISADVDEEGTIVFIPVSIGFKF